MLTQNQVLHGDCTQVLRSLPSGSVDLVVTDPPYFVRYRDRGGRSIANDGDPGSVLGAFTDLYRVLKPNTFCVSFYGWNSVAAFFDAWKSAGFKAIGHIVWHKGYSSRRGFLNARHEQAYVLAKGRPGKPAQPLDDVQPWEYSGNVVHPTEKAVQRPQAAHPVFLTTWCACSGSVRRIGINSRQCRAHWPQLPRSRA